MKTKRKGVNIFPLKVEVGTRTVTVQRHTLLTRILHWTILTEGVLLAMSGMQLGGILPIAIFPGNVLAFHIIVGIVFLGTANVFIYDVIITEYYKWIGLFWYRFWRIPYSIKYIFSEAKAWFGLAPEPADPRLYDTKKKDYVEKLIPSVVMVFWMFVILGSVLAFTGLALAFPSTFSFVYAVLNPIGSVVVGVTGLPLMLAIHRLATYLLVSLVLMHVYAVFLFKLVRSMINGKEEVRAI